MWRRISLRSRVLILLTVLIAITMGGGLITIWYAYHVDRLFGSVIDRDVTALRASEELEISLLFQKGFLTYFYLDGDPKWLKELKRYQDVFNIWLKKARKSDLNDEERDLLNQIETDYLHYLFYRDRVIALYQQGKREAGAALHEDVRRRFYEILSLCDKYTAGHSQAILNAKKESRSRAHAMNIAALSATIGVCLLGALLAFTLLRQILEPIRRLAMDGGGAHEEIRFANEVKALKGRVDRLLEDVDDKRSRLEQSQEHLAQTEKWALVGKLAAGMAHSIRNPLTSVKMRLFSMGRSLDFSETEREDFEVISEEIRHLDTIVQNFLEFSRPPKFKMQKASPSDSVDTALQLLRHRLESARVDVEVRRKERLPNVWMDPEQLKEALVNLLLNACEAMPGGGSIVIQEENGTGGSDDKTVLIRITDNGPGIPDSIQDKVFQPFFTSKGDGTGLGLSIARRIVEGHGGFLDFHSREGEGTTFMITLEHV
jgi:signal transduction histidine kinase